MPYWQLEKTKTILQIYILCFQNMGRWKIYLVSGGKDRSRLLLLWWVAKIRIVVIPRSRSAPNVQVQQTKIPPGWNMISSALVAVEVFIKNAHVPTFTQPPTSELDVNKLCDSHMWRKCRFLFTKWVLIRVRTALCCVDSQQWALWTFLPSSIFDQVFNNARYEEMKYFFFQERHIFFLEKATSRGAHRISWFQWSEFSRHK